QRCFPGDIQIWAYLHDPENSTAVRQSGLTGRMTTDGKQDLFSEIAFPPFGLILSFDAVPLEQNLCTLTYFNLYGANAWQVTFLNMSVLPFVSYSPGNFRTVDENKKSAEESKRLGSYYLDVPTPVAKP